MENLKEKSSLEIEKAIVGCLIQSDNTRQYLSRLSEEYFFDARYKNMFIAVKEMYSSDMSIDLISLRSYLESKNMLSAIGGVVTIMETLEEVVSDVHIETYIVLLYKYFLIRELQILFNRNINRIANGDEPMEIIDSTLTRLNDLVIGKGIKEDIKSLSQASKEVVERAKENMSEKKEMSGMPTGFDYFDTQSGGLQPGSLVTIAAESSQGKTSMALSIAYNAMRRGFSGAYYSLEMPSRDLAARLLSMDIDRSDISPRDLLYKKLTLEKFSDLEDHAATFGDAHLYFDDRIGANIDTIINSIAIMKLKYDISFAVVDYLQILVTGQIKGTEEAELANIARRLKNLAMKEKIVIIDLSQLSRDRQNPEPRNVRLRGSGQIEEASDVMMLLYRAEAYGLEYSAPFDKLPVKGTALVKVSKGRNIGTFAFPLLFNKNTTKFSSYNKSETSNDDNSLWPGA